MHSLHSLAAAEYCSSKTDVIMDIFCYFYFFLVKLIKYLYFISVVWLIL